MQHPHHVLLQNWLHIYQDITAANQVHSRESGIFRQVVGSKNNHFPQRPRHMEIPVTEGKIFF
jgi:hypothetical protein